MSRCLGVLFLTFWLTSMSHATDPDGTENGEQAAAVDEALLEFLGATDQLDDWNEFFDMAEDGLPPEFAEANDE